MKILLDECVDQRLARFIEGHEVDTVSGRGWNGTKNGALFAIVVLAARSNRLAEIRLLVPELLRILPFAKSGEVRNVGV